MRIALALIAVAAGGLFSYDPSAPLGWRDAGSVDTRDGITVRDVSFLAPGLGRVRAYLVLPAGDGPFPAVVWSPGSNGSRDYMTEDARAVAKRGIAGLLPDPAAPVLECSAPARERTMFVRNVVLLRRAVDALQSLRQIDRTRIGAVGFSYGAMVTATAAGVEPRLRAVVLDSGRGHHSTAMKQFCGKSVPGLDAIDPVRWVGRSRAPVLVQNGTRDPVTPRAEALALARAAHTSVHWYPTPHPLNERAFADRAAFLVRHLGAKRAPSSAAVWHRCVRAGERHGFLRTADGTKIAYAEAGSGTGGIVFAHGARSDLCSWMWALRDPRLRHFRMLAFDFRGSGLSDYPDYPESVRYTQDVVAAVAQLRRDGARRVAVLGVSRGGPAALAGAAALYPKRVQAAIAVASIDELVGIDAVASVRASRVPLLVLVNAHDGLGLTPTSRAIYKASAAKDKQLVIAPGQGHADVFRFPAVWKAFVAFLDRELRVS
jgi:dienelactone hydrolase